MYGDQNELSPTKLPGVVPGVKMPTEPTPILLSPRDDGTRTAKVEKGKPDVDDSRLCLGSLCKLRRMP